MSRSEGPELLRNAPAAGFAAEYDAGAQPLARFYAGHPRAGDAFERKAAEVAGRRRSQCRESAASCPNRCRRSP